jgi:hypothetical protein
MDAFTASSVNSGNSFRHWRNVITSLASKAICFGNSSGSGGSSTTGRRACGGALCVPRPRRWGTVMAGLWSEPPAWRDILRGKRSAAFSWKRYETTVKRSRRWNVDERMPTDEPSWRDALAKLRSSLSRLLTRLQHYVGGRSTRRTVKKANGGRRPDQTRDIPLEPLEGLCTDLLQVFIHSRCRPVSSPRKTQQYCKRYSRTSWSSSKLGSCKPPVPSCHR